MKIIENAGSEIKEDKVLKINLIHNIAFESITLKGTINYYPGI